VSGNPRTRLTSVLFGRVALANTGYIAAVTVSTLAARSMTGSARLAGLPGAVAVIGTAIGASLLAADIARAGRRRGMVVGYLLGSTGAALAATAVVNEVYALLLAGLFILGFGQAASQMSRYAAGDIAIVERKGAAVSLIVWAGTVGAVVGPSLLDPAGAVVRSWGRPQYMGGYLIASLFMGLACVAYLVGLRPDPSTLSNSAAGPATAGRHETTLAEASPWSNPAVQAALASMVFGQVVMVLIMTGTPLHIEDTGRGLEVVGLVISAHTIGMFAFSPLTGRVVDRFGPMRVMLGAIGINASAAVLAAAAPDSSTGLLAAALFLLGIGWNAGFVAGSALLSRTVGAAVQGSVDSLVWGSSAVASLSSGIVLDMLGYRSLSLIAIVLLAVPLTLLMARRRLVFA
jgi:MFS family permease